MSGRAGSWQQVDMRQGLQREQAARCAKHPELSYVHASGWACGWVSRQAARLAAGCTSLIEIGLAPGRAPAPSGRRKPTNPKPKHSLLGQHHLVCAWRPLALKPCQ